MAAQDNLSPKQFEDVQHILKNYKPSDFGSWDETRNNTVWDAEGPRKFVADIKAHGVQRPVPINYETSPPTVMNGHTRVLAAERAGVKQVPVRQHEGFMDPDDPDPWGNQESGHAW